MLWMRGLGFDKRDINSSIGLSADTRRLSSKAKQVDCFSRYVLGELLPGLGSQDTPSGLWILEAAYMVAMPRCRIQRHDKYLIGS